MRVQHTVDIQDTNYELESRKDATAVNAKKASEFIERVGNKLEKLLQEVPISRQ